MSTERQDEKDPTLVVQSSLINQLKSSLSKNNEDDVDLCAYVASELAAHAVKPAKDASVATIGQPVSATVSQPERKWSMDFKPNELNAEQKKDVRYWTITAKILLKSGQLRAREAASCRLTIYENEYDSPVEDCTFTMVGRNIKGDIVRHLTLEH